MAKIGRNEPCPCSSGKKYKKCCGPRDQALAAERARAPSIAQVKSALGSALESWVLEDDGLDAASNRVVDLVHDGRLDEAEQAAHALLRDYPAVHDGFERLGMVYEARGDRARAAQMYKSALDFTLNHEGYDEEARDWYRTKLADLERPEPSPTP